MLFIMTVDIISIFKPFPLEGEKSLKRYYIKMCCGMEYYSAIKRMKYCHVFATWMDLEFSRSVVSDSLWLYGLQLARAYCPSPTPGVYSNSCPFSCWCHPTISSSVIPFSFHLQSFPASGSFQMSQFFASEYYQSNIKVLEFILRIRVISKY